MSTYDLLLGKQRESRGLFGSIRGGGQSRPGHQRPLWTGPETTGKAARLARGWKPPQSQGLPESEAYREASKEPRDGEGARQDFICTSRSTYA